MKNWKILFSVLLLSVFLYGCSSSADESDAYQPENNSTELSNSFILEDITQGNTTEESLRINAQLVEQKLTDLEDYINLLTKKEVPAEFAENIYRQMDKLIYVTDTTETSYLNLKSWIAQRVEGKKKLNFSQINLMKESFEYANGELRMDAECKTNAIAVKKEKMRFTFVLRKVDKHFGDNKISVKEMRISGMQRLN